MVQQWKQPPAWLCKAARTLQKELWRLESRQCALLGLSAVNCANITAHSVGLWDRACLSGGWRGASC